MKRALLVFIFTIAVAWIAVSLSTAPVLAAEPIIIGVPTSLGLPTGDQWRSEEVLRRIDYDP